jgi:tRNA pseudouridine55 synthase
MHNTHPISRIAAIHGILNINKPAGMTSHDVVQAIRRVSGQRRIGHCGTLDPMATGVLLVCLGEATRVVEYLMSGRKTYRAVIHLGIATDSYDATGQIVHQAPAEQVAQLTLEVIERAVSAFVGAITQTPPMYSAIKQDGKPLYRLARQGIEVEREARQVEIHDFQLLDWTPPRLAAEITCSKGTYIRSLAHDLGQALGCGGHLAELARTASGRFMLAEAVPLSETLKNWAAGDWQQHLLPLEIALTEFPAWTLDESTVLQVRHGQEIAASETPESHAETEWRRAYSPQGQLVALLRYNPSSARWHPDKVFLAD